MKKFIATLLVAAIFAVMLPAMSGTTSAQTTYSDNGNAQYQGYRRPSVYSRHRKLINIGAATGAGAIIGKLIGGRKGALIGAAAGAGGGYIFTKKQRPRNYNRQY